MEADTHWMRQCADDMDATGGAVGKLLGNADGAVGALKGAAPGWTFTDSVDELSSRWETLNKLVRDELSEAAENIRFNASDIDGNENIITETLHNIFG
ncbi:hypothetical protein [Streptomyces sp. NPDC014733]|uniref:hypothetical protein n=1 Tax=Streptomyces sp. NPDC014733 TaxID=3364885 RepID=UPI003702C89A